VAPEFASGVLDIFAAKPNLRVMKIGNLARLTDFTTQRVVDFKSLMDGGLITQWSFVPEARRTEQLLPASCEYKGKTYRTQRTPTPHELDDLLFGWLVEAGVTSNSVLYIKDGVTVGIGTGEQDRVGVAEIARDKAYRKLADWLSWEQHRTPFNDLQHAAHRQSILDEVAARKGGLIGSCMVSDAFFPFRDGAEVGIREGVSAIVQPGGSMRDWDVIECCNAANVAMVFTGQRSFRH
jgi:phosphoribosylaminoimidazolecarboxamide formyltransferase/IMP cyclohydrolase